MSLIICPSCGRSIDLPEAEMHLPSIQCAVCDTHFSPAVRETPRFHDAKWTIDVMGIFAIVFGSVGTIAWAILREVLFFDIAGLVFGLTGLCLSRSRGRSGICSVVGIALSVAAVLLFLSFRLHLLRLTGSL